MFCHVYYFEKNKGAVLNLQGCKSSSKYVIKELLSVSTSGNSVRIEDPDLGNALTIGNRNVYVIDEKLSVYDLGQSDDTDPVYDLGQSDEVTPVYDLGQSDDVSPIYDLGQEKTKKETFKAIVKKTLDKHQIYTRDDLIRFCNGSSRKKIYDAVLKDCPPKRCDGKHFKQNVRHHYEELLSGFKIHKETKGLK
jgi:hypothetical protein